MSPDSEKTSQTSAEVEEKQLCVSCAFPNEPVAHFCAKCGAPLTSYASTGPFEQLLAEGAVYRQAAERPRSLVVVLGVWLIFGMMALFSLAVLMISRGSSFLGAVFGACLLVFSVVMIWKTTRNYLTRKQIKGESDGQSD